MSFEYTRWQLGLEYRAWVGAWNYMSGPESEAGAGIFIMGKPGEATDRRVKAALSESDLQMFQPSVWLVF